MATANKQAAHNTVEDAEVVKGSETVTSNSGKGSPTQETRVVTQENEPSMLSTAWSMLKPTLKFLGIVSVSAGAGYYVGRRSAKSEGQKMYQLGYSEGQTACQALANSSADNTVGTMG